jgi:DNA replication and repair protein RecF
MLTELQLRSFRCFDALRVEMGGGFNFFIGQNGQGKTSILEGACVLLRLQSQRSSMLAPLIKVGQRSFALTGRYEEHALEFRYSRLRRKLSFDQVEQRGSAEYLRIARVVSLANMDIELVRGGSEFRRRFLDFLGAQIEPSYRLTLRLYEKALRSRNALLKSAPLRPRELAAYDPPLIEHGANLSRIRAELVAGLTDFASDAHREISGIDETLALQFAPGNGDDFAEELAHSAAEEARLRQTVVGPHRDDITLLVDGMPAAQFASEGQQRTVALALKIAQARVFTSQEGSPPLLLIDDVFGELDPERRNRFLAALPSASQKLVTATSMKWQEGVVEGPHFELRDRELHAVNA